MRGRRATRVRHGRAGAENGETHHSELAFLGDDERLPIRKGKRQAAHAEGKSKKAKGKIKRRMKTSVAFIYIFAFCLFTSAQAVCLLPFFALHLCQRFSSSPSREGNCLMQGVVSLLDDRHYAKVEAVWEELG